MKKSLLILSILLISNNSFAQLIETMGSLGIQGSMTNQAVTQTKKMNDAVKMDSFLRVFNEKVVMMQINILLLLCRFHIQSPADVLWLM